MKRPILNKLKGRTLPTSGICVTMSVGQWDKLLEGIYDSGGTLLEVDGNGHILNLYCRSLS